MPMRIDCHGHVWSADPEEFPYSPERGSPPPPTDKLGTAEVLLEGMDAAGVDGMLGRLSVFVTHLLCAKS